MGNTTGEGASVDHGGGRVLQKGERSKVVQSMDGFGGGRVYEKSESSMRD
jgi:hypothetical protein